MTPTQAEALREMRAYLTGLGCDARFDPITTTLYSTDASNHQVAPLGVVLPRDREEVCAVVAKAAEVRLPILPRGAGTSLAGQAVGACLILDTSRHLDHLRSIDREGQTAIVEPGVVCQTLNAAVGRMGLKYGPDPASADRATFGGMLGNNATGAHSIRYGMSADHLLKATLVLSDGNLAEWSSVSVEEAERRSLGSSREAAIYRSALDLRASLGEEIASRWPRTWRRASGYGLNYLTGQTLDSPGAWYRAPEAYMESAALNIPGALCGSEGTLGVMVEAEVRLVPKPLATALLLLPFESVLAACQATTAILEAGPSAVELVPAALLERARRVPAYARRLGFLAEVPKALLAVEFEGDSPPAAGAAARRLPGFPGIVLEDIDSQTAFWDVRRAGLGLLMSVPGDVKANTFIEDVTVPVGHLSEYVQRVERILADHGTYGEWYAHASAGCLHLRPMLNLKTQEGRRDMRQIAEEVVAVVCELGGVVSGEHGDGLSHTEFNARLFGPRLTEAFRQWKRSFDPEGILNPGKVVEMPSAPTPAIDGQMRYRPDYGMRLPFEAHFAYRREQGFLRAVEDCSGVGVCRKAEGVMCPSFQATREESDSTRGRANALRAALTGFLPTEVLLRPEMYRILDLCLECKGCKAECPTAVDMARIKAEYLALYHQKHGVPLRSRLFGQIARVQAAVAPIGFVQNGLRRTPLFRRGLEAIVGIDRRRTLPAIRTEGFRRSVPPIEVAPHGAHPVVLFVDTFTDHNEPEVGAAALRLLHAAGMSVGRVPGQVCCGRPLISKGLLNEARELARRNIDALAPYARAGIPVVGLEPSCLLTLRDEYLELFPDDEAARAVAGAARLLEELFTEDNGGGSLLARLDLRPSPHKVLVHNHCHSRALVGSAPMLEMLRAASSAVQETTAGCCGMAGSFGYEKEHYALSMKIGGMRLFPEAESASAEGGIIIAPGMSCRTQVRDGTGQAAVHPAVFLAGRLGEP